MNILAHLMENLKDCSSCICAHKHDACLCSNKDFMLFRTGCVYIHTQCAFISLHATCISAVESLSIKSS